MAQVTEIAIADSFVDALARMDRGEAKKVAGFLEKLVLDPATQAAHAKIVHDARDRAVRSLRASKDLRIIGHIDGARLALLYVDQHARAYKWARDACIECHPVNGELRIVTEAEREAMGVEPDRMSKSPRTAAAGSGAPVTLYLCATTGDLCRVLGARGIEHGLDASAGRP